MKKALNMSMTQLQDDDAEEYNYSTSKESSNNILMTQIQIDDDSSSGEEDDEYEVAIDKEQHTMLSDDDILDDMDDEKNENHVADDVNNSLVNRNKGDEHIFKAPDLPPSATLQHRNISKAPSPGSSTNIMGSINNQNGNGIESIDNDTDINKAQQIETAPKTNNVEGESEELSLFLSQSQTNNSNNESQVKEMSMAEKSNEKNGIGTDENVAELSLHLSQDKIVAVDDIGGKDVDNNTSFLSQPRNNVTGTKNLNNDNMNNSNANNGNINNGKTHAISQISQLEIDHESEIQIANMAEIAVREEIIPQQKDHMLPVSQSQDIVSTATNQNEDNALDNIAQLMLYTIQKLAFYKLKKNMNSKVAAKIAAVTIDYENDSDKNEVSSLTQPHLSLSQQPNTNENRFHSVEDNGIVCLNNNDIDSQGMISLSYESSAYEESQSQLKVPSSITDSNVKNAINKHDGAITDAVAATPLSVTQPNVVEQQCIKLVESSMSMEDKSQALEQKNSSSIASVYVDRNQLIEETPQSQHEVLATSKMVVKLAHQLNDTDRKSDHEADHDSAWISTTANTNFKQLKKDYLKSKVSNNDGAPSSPTKKIPLLRKINASSIMSDDDDNEIDNIAKGNMDVANIDEGEEEPPSETALLDVSEHEESEGEEYGDASSNGNATNTRTKQRSAEDEEAVSNIISTLFPTARANDVGIKSFYIQVKKVFGKNFDDSLWIPFVWDTVYNIMNKQKDESTGQEDQSAESMETSNFSNDHDDNIPLSQVGSSYAGMSQESSQSQCQPNQGSLFPGTKGSKINTTKQKHEEWNLATHRNKRNRDNTTVKKSVSTTTDDHDKQAKNVDKESKMRSNTKSFKAKKASPLNVWKLADALHQENLADVFLKDDQRWRDLFHLLKQRGWKWAYGSGVIEKKYLTPGTTIKSGIVGTTVFHSARDVVDFVWNNEPKPDMLLAEECEVYEEAEDRENSHIATLSMKTKAKVDKCNDGSAKYDRNTKLITLLTKASKNFNEITGEPKGWREIFTILKSRGWEYKKAPRSIALKCAWVYLEPPLANSDKKKPIMHEGERDAVQALCARFEIHIPSAPVVTSRRRKRKKEIASPKKRTFEDDLAEAIQRSQKKAKQTDSTDVELFDVKKHQGEERVRKRKREDGGEDDNFITDKMSLLLKDAAEHDNIATDPPGWKEIFSILQDKGWYYKNSSSGLRAWDYVSPANDDSFPTVIYPNPRAVARAICDKYDITYDAPTESQENSRSRRSRRPPKRFSSPKPRDVKKKPKLSNGKVVDENDEEDPKASPHKKQDPIDQELASSPSNFAATYKASKILKKKKKEKKIFTGFHFMLSGLSSSIRKSLKTTIRRNGGFIYNEISTFEDDMKECEKTPVEGENEELAAFVVLSLCEPSAYRKAKYLYSLAVGVPVVHYSWINDCLEEKEQLNILKYILPNGLSMSHGMYRFPPVKDNTQHSIDSPVRNNDIEDLSILSPKPSSTALTGIFNQMKIGLHGTSGNKRKNDPHTDWWHILNIAGASVYEGDINYLKKMNVDAFVCRMDDFRVLPELRKLAKRKNVPLVTFEWCIQSLIDGTKLPFDKLPTFSAGKAGGSSSKGTSERGLEPVWASAMLTVIGHADRKYFSALRINGNRYCIGDLVYMKRPWLKSREESNTDNDDDEEKVNNKYQFRLGIIESFWEMKNTGEKRVKWQLLDRVNAGNGNFVVATGEYVDSPLHTMHGKFMMFNEHEVLTPSTMPQKMISDDRSPSATRLYFQVRDEEDDGYYEIVADEKYDVYLIKK